MRARNGLRMSAVGDPRQYVLKYLSDRCGFQVNESSDLSPDTRSEIGELARGVPGIWGLDAKMAEQRALLAKSPPGTGFASFLAVLFLVGGVLGITAAPDLADFVPFDSFPGGAPGMFFVGVFFFIVAAANSMRRHQKVRSVLASLQAQRDKQWQAWASRADALSRTVMEESREAYQQKVKPRVIQVKVDFAEIMRAAQGKGVIFDRVKCPSCGASISLPPSGDLVRCSYCGNEITATSVLDKLKSILA